MNTFARFAVFGIAAAATVTLAACGSGTTTAGSTTAVSTTAAATSSIASTTASSGGMMSGGISSAGATDTASHNDADVTFSRQMIIHHQGAIEMADLAPTRAASQQVKDLAAKIKAAQAPEIQLMTGWLQTWDAGMAGTAMMSSAAGQLGTSMMSTGSPGMGDMGNGMNGADGSNMQMPGMMTADQMTQLAAATGADFDRLFLELMITHHQGAVAMAETELTQGANPDAQALAESIKTSQAQEIATMQQLLQTL